MIFAIGLTAPIKGEKACLSRSTMRTQASQVVFGTAVGVYEHNELKGNCGYTRLIAELLVSDEEKDNKKDASGLGYTRYWKLGWIAVGRVPTSTAGDRGLPSESGTRRAHLARNDFDGSSRDNKVGGSNIIDATGFARLKTNLRK
ncbi:hypothetical protein OAG76_02005 [Rubripirellula sp.]|nr:hypothetical protein [Rubripirellula sp.]MDC0317130.1 hypothetical protein [bacterium]